MKMTTNAQRNAQVALILEIIRSMMAITGQSLEQAASGGDGVAAVRLQETMEDLGLYVAKGEVPQ